jgi:hypothetical protein
VALTGAGLKPNLYTGVIMAWGHDQEFLIFVIRDDRNDCGRDHCGCRWSWCKWKEKVGVVWQHVKAA